jgi:hypothetical protein
MAVTGFATVACDEYGVCHFGAAARLRSISCKKQCVRQRGLWLVLLLLPETNMRYAILAQQQLGFAQ